MLSPKHSHWATCASSSYLTSDIVLSFVLKLYSSVDAKIKKKKIVNSIMLLNYCVFQFFHEAKCCVLQNIFDSVLEMFSIALHQKVCVEDLPYKLLWIIVVLLSLLQNVYQFIAG